MRMNDALAATYMIRRRTRPGHLQGRRKREAGWALGHPGT
jgi:hypothetical protein